MSLVLDGLVKRFGPVTALDGISFQVPKGQVFGFLGANGAGKTTTMRIVLDILRPDAGTAQWDGTPTTDVPRETWGYLPEERGLYPRLQVLDQLIFFASLYGIPRNLTELASHRIVKQSAPQVDDGAYARVLGLKSLEGIVGIKTNSSVGALYAVERGAGIGFLPTASIALGAPLVPIDLGVSHHADLWLTYHREFRSSERHKIVVEWLKKIFDPKVYPCFRDEFIHPNALVPMMTAARQDFGLNGYVAAAPG